MLLKKDPSTFRILSHLRDHSGIKYQPVVIFMPFVFDNGGIIDDWKYLSDMQPLARIT